jgi:hypothetical protein
MSMKDLMLEQLAISRRIVSDGHEVVPAWRVETPDGAWLILTRFDPAKPGQSERALYLVRRFMAWKFARAFVMTAETWLDTKQTGVVIEPSATREEAVTAVGASGTERLAVLQRIRRKDAAVEFGPLEWLSPEQCDSLYWTLLPRREETVTAKEAAELAAIFAESGELPAQKLN